MKLSRTSIVLGALAGVLAFNPAVFAQETKPASTNKPPAGQRGGPGGPGGGGERRGMMTADNQLTRLSEQLKLTDEQKPKAKAVLEEQFKQMQASRELPQEERQPKMRAAREEANKKMKEILTAEQFKQYEDLQAQMRQRRGAGGPGGPGGPAAANAEKPAEKTEKPVEKPVAK